ncbi:MAG TPA: BatA and WFA domain-containing protein [Verrucomicrobiae bacterium]|nr:BatA and WFA domain-containing protein [Verrucomicrobiae bacterium]
MSFLSPTLFAALIPLAALPLVIHLLNKGFPRHFRFPSVELIQQTLAQRSRLHRWRHWILLLLRTAFLLLLLLAFLRPVLPRFGGDPAAAGARHVLIVLDHSASMEHKGDGPTSRERAVHEAVKLIDSLSAEDRVNILLLEASPETCFVGFSDDHAEARRFLSKLKPGLTRGDVNLANALAARLLAGAATRPEVYYLSDFQRKNWANANFTALPPATRMYFVDVGPSRKDNRAVLQARLAQTQILAGDTVALEIAVGNFTSAEFAGRITVTVDQRFNFEQETTIAPWSEGKVTVPVAVGGPGLHLCEVRLPADALELDNRFYLTLAVQEKEEVLIVTDGATDAHSGAYFLKTALNPFANESGSLLPRIIGTRELSPSRLAGVNKMFFTQLNRLPEEAVAAVQKFVFQGGGLIYFLDGEADAENLAALEKAVSPEVMPIRLTQRRKAQNVGSGAQQVVRGDFKSRYLKLFQGDARQNLALLEFYDYYQASTRADGVLLTYADDSPAMAALHHGRGTVLLLNFSAGELSSNLARQRVFPAWMQELVKAVAATEPPPIAHTIGESLHTEVWRDDLRTDFKNPAGAVVSVKREPNGERYSITFTPEQLGFYTLGEPRPLHAFGINGSPEEADLRPMDKEVLPKEFAAERPAHFVAGADDFAELASGRPLFHWFIIAGVVFLLLESGVQLLLRRKAA